MLNNASNILLINQDTFGVGAEFLLAPYQLASETVGHIEKLEEIRHTLQRLNFARLNPEIELRVAGAPTPFILTVQCDYLLANIDCWLNPDHVLEYGSAHTHHLQPHELIGILQEWGAWSHSLLREHGHDTKPLQTLLAQAHATLFVRHPDLYCTYGAIVDRFTTLASVSSEMWTSVFKNYQSEIPVYYATRAEKKPSQLDELSPEQHLIKQLLGAGHHLLGMYHDDRGAITTTKSMGNIACTLQNLPMTLGQNGLRSDQLSQCMSAVLDFLQANPEQINNETNAQQPSMMHVMASWIVKNASEGAERFVHIMNQRESNLGAHGSVYKKLECVTNDPTLPKHMSADQLVRIIKGVNTGCEMIGSESLFSMLKISPYRREQKARNQDETAIIPHFILAFEQWLTATIEKAHRNTAQECGLISIVERATREEQRS